jgi:hypothetical protein
MSVPDKPSTTTLPYSLPNTLRYFWSAPYDGGSPLSSYTLTLNPGNLVYNPPPSANDFSIGGLTNGLTYSATLKAANANGFSEEATFSISQPGNLPNPPASLAVYPAGTDSALVVWTPPAVSPDATIFWYVIETESTNPADPVLKFSADGLTQTSYLVPGLNSASSYYFKVYAVNYPGYSKPLYSNPLSFVQNAGNVQWATRQNAAVNTNITPGGGGTTVDKDGNVYICGFFNSTTLTLFNYGAAPATPGGEITVTLAATYTAGASGQNNSYLAKYNSAGILQWATIVSAATTTGTNASTVEVDADNNVYFCGIVGTQNPYTFTNFTGIVGTTLQVSTYGTFRSSSANDAYILKYNSSGQIQWFTTVSGTSSELFFNRGKTLAIDTNGNVYACFGSGSPSIFSAGSVIAGVITPIHYGNRNNTSGNLVKWNSAGQAQWIANINTGGGSIYSLAIDRTNNVYTIGTVANTSLTFVEQAGFSTNIISTTLAGFYNASGVSGDGWITKYDTNGKFKGASRSIGTVFNPLQLSINQFNELYVGAITTSTRLRLFSYVSTLNTGLISTTMWGEYVRPSTAAARDVLTIKLNTDLQFQGINSIYSLTADTLIDPSGMTTDSYGNVYHAGLYRSPSTFLRTYISGGGGEGALSTLTFSTIGLLSNAGFASFGYIAKFDRNLQYQWINYTQANNGSPTAGLTAATSNWSLYVDRFNNLYATGQWAPSAGPQFMYFTNPAGIAADGRISTTTYGYLSTFTTVGGTLYSNAYLVKYS